MKSMLAPQLGLLFPILLAAGCASSGPVRSLAIAANNKAVVERNLDGTVALRSQQAHIVSVLPLSGKFSSDTFALPSLYVIVTNGGKENLTLKPDDISAYAGDQEVALLNPAKLQDRLDRAQAAASGSSGSNSGGGHDASQAAEAPHGYHSRHPSAPGPAVESYGAPNFKVPTRVVGQALQSQVIRPGEAGGGRIVLEAEDILSGLPLKIVVAVAGEQHEFLFEVRY